MARSSRHLDIPRLTKQLSGELPTQASARALPEVAPADRVLIGRVIGQQLFVETGLTDPAQLSKIGLFCTYDNASSHMAYMTAAETYPGGRQRSSADPMAIVARAFRERYRQNGDPRVGKATDTLTVDIEEVNYVALGVELDATQRGIGHGYVELVLSDEGQVDEAAAIRSFGDFNPRKSQLALRTMRLMGISGKLAIMDDPDFKEVVETQLDAYVPDTLDLLPLAPLWPNAPAS